MTDTKKTSSTENTDREEVTANDTVEEGEIHEEKAAAEDVVAEEAEEETELERLRSEFEQVRTQAAEYLDGWQRAQAEFANYRKRQEAEWQQRVQMSNATLIAKMLPVLDDLQRAAQTLPPSLHGLTWIEGFFLITRKLEMVLESEGVKPIETGGQTFDPLYHEAMSYEELEGYEDGKIIDEIQRGYVLGDRVIRPALVRVARAPQPAAEENEKAHEEEADDETTE